MAVLSDERRAAIWRQVMADCSAQGMALPVTKPDLRAAVDALDTWVDANAAAANSALPQPFRGAAGQKLKAMVLMQIVDERYHVTPPEPG